MTTMTLNIKDSSILPQLLKVLGDFKGVVVETVSLPSQTPVEGCLSKEEGEQLVRETLLPAYRDAVRAEKEGVSLPDAHEILQML